MTAIKERIIGAISIMSEDDAQMVWELITDNFPKNSWDTLPEAVPDEWDLQMIERSRNDPDCHSFVSSEEAMQLLDLN